MNPENLIYTSIHAHKFNTEYNNVANIIRLLKAKRCLKLYCLQLPRFRNSEQKCHLKKHIIKYISSKPQGTSK
jgi:hypothetical protein